MGIVTQRRCQAVVVDLVLVLDAEFAQRGHRVETDSVENRYGQYQKNKLWAQRNAV